MSTKQDYYLAGKSKSSAYRYAQEYTFYLLLGLFLDWNIPAVKLYHALLKTSSIIEIVVG